MIRKPRKPAQPLKREGPHLIGKKGGRYYISKGGKKVYLRPGAHAPRVYRDLEEGQEKRIARGLVKKAHERGDLELHAPPRRGAAGYPPGVWATSIPPAQAHAWHAAGFAYDPATKKYFHAGSGASAWASEIKLKSPTQKKEYKKWLEAQGGAPPVVPPRVAPPAAPPRAPPAAPPPAAPAKAPRGMKSGGAYPPGLWASSIPPAQAHAWHAAGFAYDPTTKKYVHAPSGAAAWASEIKKKAPSAVAKFAKWQKAGGIPRGPAAAPPGWTPPRAPPPPPNNPMHQGGYKPLFSTKVAADALGQRTADGSWESRPKDGKEQTQRIQMAVMEHIGIGSQIFSDTKLKVRMGYLGSFNSAGEFKLNEQSSKDIEEMSFAKPGTGGAGLLHAAERYRQTLSTCVHETIHGSGRRESGPNSRQNWDDIVNSTGGRGLEEGLTESLSLGLTGKIGTKVFGKGSEYLWEHGEMLKDHSYHRDVALLTVSVGFATGGAEFRKRERRHHQEAEAIFASRAAYASAFSPNQRAKSLADEFTDHGFFAQKKTDRRREIMKETLNPDGDGVKLLLHAHQTMNTIAELPDLLADRIVQKHCSTDSAIEQHKRREALARSIRLHTAETRTQSGGRGAPSPEYMALRLSHSIEKLITVPTHELDDHVRPGAADKHFVGGHY